MLSASIFILLKWNLDFYFFRPLKMKMPFNSGINCNIFNTKYFESLSLVLKDTEWRTTNTKLEY